MKHGGKTYFIQIFYLFEKVCKNYKMIKIQVCFKNFSCEKLEFSLQPESEGF